MTSTFYPVSPISIRDGTKARVLATGLFKTVLKARVAPTQDEQLPLACVFNGGERTQPEGDPNVGPPKFLHTLTLAIEIMVAGASEAAADVDIVAMVETVRATLLTDKTWVDQFDGIERCDTRYAYPKEAGNILVQAIIEIDVTYKSEWMPVVPNDFKQVAVYAEPTRYVTCAYCGTRNPSGVMASRSCSTCSAALPEPSEPLLTIIDIAEACP